MSLISLPPRYTAQRVRDEFPDAIEHIERLDPEDWMHEGQLVVWRLGPTRILCMEPDKPTDPLFWHPVYRDWFIEDDYPDSLEGMTEDTET